MSEKEIYSVLSILMGFVSAYPYVRSMIRGETKPHMFSWLIWSIVSYTGGFVQLQSGGGAGSWLLLLNATYSLGITAASFRYGTRDIKTVDWFVLFVALSAIPLGYLMQMPLLASLIAIAIDAVAYVPTIRKSWNQPRQESAISWAISALMFVLSLMAQERYVPETYLYPAIFACINLALTCFLLLRRRLLEAKE